MIRKFFSFIWRVLKAIWSVIDVSRRLVLNVLFLLIVVALIAGAYFGRSGDAASSALQAKTTLTIHLAGSLPEQRQEGERASLMRVFQADGAYQPLLREVVAVIDQAAQDPKITQMVLSLDDLGGAGLASLNEVARALDRFKAKGKPVIAWASTYRQGAYYLAAHASQAYLHPQGSVELTGFGGSRWYFKDALDKLGVQFHLIKVGTYKSAAEPFIANGPSPAAQEASAFLYGDLWTRYTGDVENARKLPKNTVATYIDTLPQALQKAGGDSAKLALSIRLVDGLKTFDELMPILLKAGAEDAGPQAYRHVDVDQYLKRVPAASGDAPIGIIVAEGEIVGGRSEAGRLGDRTLTELIRRARQDKQIKAVVLRVNSPGGSALASEMIRHELGLLRAAGKPVVVSMGNVAASGGYWISMASDAVYADASTVTGSIGVFGLLPTAPQALNKLGIHAGGTGTTWLSNAGDVSQPLDPRLASIIQSNINHVYADFIGLTAKARKVAPEKIEAVAQGRVWTGKQAQARGLVDQIGGLADAQQAAAKLAKLPGTAKARYIEAEPTLLASFVSALGQQTRLFLSAQLQLELGALGGATTAMQAAKDDTAWLVDLARRDTPFTAVAHCFCRVQ